MSRITKEGSPLLALQPDQNAVSLLRACLSPACFWPPEQLGPEPPWLEHAPFAFWLIEALRPRVLVELGTHGGYSYFSFCQAVRQLGLETRCYAVDTWKGDEHAGFYGEEVYAQVRARNDRLYAAFSTLIRSTFDEALPRFDDSTVDLLHIDGRHRYADVKRDFESWKAKLSERSVVLFHDTNVSDRDFGVFRFWQELSAQYPNLEFVHGHGLGVLGFGSELPHAVRNLFAAQGDREALTQIRDAYSRLGSALSLQMRADRQSAELAHQSAAVIRLAEELALTKQSSEVELGLIRRDAARSQERVRQLERTLDTHSDQLRSTRMIVTRTQAQLTSLQSTLDASRNSISWRITAPLRTLKSVVANNRARVARCAMIAPLRTLKSVVANNRARIARCAMIAMMVRARVRLPRAIRTRRDIHAITRSGLFNVRWYLERNPDVAAAHIDPIRHYVEYGAKEGRDPNPSFSSMQYLASNQLVAVRELNPFAHHIRRQRLDKRADDTDRMQDPPGAETAFSSGGDFSLAVPFGYRMQTRVAAPGLAVLCHLYHDDLASEFRRYFENIPFPCDVFISTDTTAKQERIREAFSGWRGPMVEVRLAENRGRDIAPKLIAFSDVYDRYRYVLHVHSKRTPRESGFEHWREFLLENLLGSPEIVTSVFEIFARFPSIGLVSSQHFLPAQTWIHWGQNLELAEQLSTRMGFTLGPDREIDFPSGSMFWARTAALKPLLELRLSVDEFPEERGQPDGTLAHAIERIYYFVCELSGFNWIKISRPTVADDHLIESIDNPERLAKIMSNRSFRLRGPDLTVAHVEVSR
jgi:hypothetical protein